MKEHSFSDETLLQLERSLKAKLNPVQPDHNFISTLRQRLVEKPTYRPRRRTAMTLLTIAGGLLFGLAIYLFGRWVSRDDSENG